MKKTLIFGALLLLFACSVAAQTGLALPPGGGSPRAANAAWVGPIEISVNYFRPAVKGREGKIWGDLVPYGFTDPGFGTSKSAPWRAGANQNTVFTVSDEVSINGKPLAAGRYALFMAVYADSVTLIFSRNSTSWGQYYYDFREDALRVTTKQVKNQPMQEWLTYDLTPLSDSTLEVALRWETWKIPFTVKAPVVQATLTSIRQQLRNEPAFNWLGLVQAVDYCLLVNTNYDEALTWADRAISEPYVGESNFLTLSIKARLLERMGRQQEADELMLKALPMGKVFEIHTYGRQLMARKEHKKALEVFLINQKQHGDVWPVNVGLARGYSANGDYKTALGYAEKALVQAPDDVNRDSLKKMIELLKAGKDGN